MIIVEADDEFMLTAVKKFYLKDIASNKKYLLRILIAYRHCHHFQSVYTSLSRVAARRPRYFGGVSGRAHNRTEYWSVSHGYNTPQENGLLHTVAVIEN